ncbi:glycosyltransferase family 4 protein [Flavobacterium lacus]|uniref:Phosphatidylinositol alpha-1,6-mannosyltransferase n=1 Tax=Flavobacterium lacus TaxID=1353778 RepID=A0A328WK73_9FLAO|nr:glycosyltransferase family 4 protein [Flavobacterium lacus]RAR46613.1 phosphatidylinositol alpha-1,6-mannosyltransferase [Flavobacterium lacus]
MNKKILIITSEFPPLPGGIGNHAFLLSKYLQINKYLIKVITNHRTNNPIDECVFDNNQSFDVVRIKRYKIVLITYFSRFINVIKNIKNSEIVLASGKFSLWCAGVAKLFYGNKKYIAIIHGSEVNFGGFMSKKLTYWSLSKMDEIIAVSQFTKDLALKNNKNLKIQVIHNGFEVNQYNNKINAIRGNPSVITVGNVSKRKGQINFIKAIPRVVNSFPDIHYHIVGVPSEKDDLSLLAQKLNISQHLTFHGLVSDEEKFKLLNASTIFIMLSNTIDKGEVEGFGIAILEANSLGIPAIGSLGSGINEAIKSGYSGILVNPNSSEEIEQALTEIVTNYQAFSLNSKEWATNFNWSFIVKKYLTVLES